VPVQLGRDPAGRIPGARFELIAGSGHCPPLEQSEAFASAVRPFLEQLAAEAAVG